MDIGNVEFIPESTVNYICKKILDNYENDKLIIPYINETLKKVRNFLSKKQNLATFNKDKFVNIIIDYIESRRVKANTHVGVLAAQSIGEPVTQSALNYIHKLTDKSDSNDGLKSLRDITHNHFEDCVVEFYIKPGNDELLTRKKIVNSMIYRTLNQAVLDVVYDGFNMRFYLCPHTIFNLRMHPKTILQMMKEYLHKMDHMLDTWESRIDLDNLYIEFIQPASKRLDWLDEKDVDYLVDSDILCVFKPKAEKEKDDDDNNDDDSSVESSDHLSKNSPKNPAITNDDLCEYFKSQNLEYDEKEKYFILDSHYIYMSAEEISTILESIILSGTKGVKKVTPKFIGNELVIEVVGNDLDPLFENKYIDKERSHYVVYSESKDVNFELRKQSILNQLKDIIHDGTDDYNDQHIELLTNFMCRDNTVVPMSRFGMNSEDYSFISRLSYEDPYNVLKDVFYGQKDNLTSVSSKLITGIFNEK